MVLHRVVRTVKLILIVIRSNNNDQDTLVLPYSPNDDCWNNKQKTTTKKQHWEEGSSRSISPTTRICLALQTDLILYLPLLLRF